MKILFWLGLTIEGLAMLYYLYQTWIIYSGRSIYEESYYPDLYRQNLIPAVLLSLIFFSALSARFYFNAPKVATWIVLSPVVTAVIAGVGMVVSSMFIKDWR